MAQMISQDFIQTANQNIAIRLEATTLENKKELARLRDKLSFTYWIIIILSIIMFIIGVVLISIPAFAAINSQIDTLESVVAAGFGIADLAALFFFKPLFRIHNIMGDMSQITLALNSYQMQVGLRLMEMEINNRPSLGKAAENIDIAATNSIKLVQKYFELEQSPK